MWLEALLLSNRLARPDGTLVGPMEPVAVGAGLRFGPRGSGVDLEWELGRTLLITRREAGLAFRWLDATREVFLQPGEVWSHDGVAGPCFRVFATREASLAWPAAVAAPLGPWSDELLWVLGDTLLEAGATVGARLNHREPTEDVAYLPLLRLLPPTCMTPTWRRGVLDTLTLQTASTPLSMLTWALGRALASHAVSKPLRALTLRGPSSLRNDLLRLLAGLAAGGLPCLGSLRCELWDSLEPPEALSAFAEELRSLPGVALGLPTLRQVDVVRFSGP